MRRFTKVVEEYSVLESLLTPSQSAKPADYSSAIKKLRDMHRPLKTSRQARPRSPYLQSVAPKVDEKLRSLLTNRNLTSRDIDAWLHINVIANAPHYQVTEQVDAVLMPMIYTANPTALWAIMQFLAKYWQSGVLGQRPLIKTARAQAEAVLERALLVSHPTEYSLGMSGTIVELVGTPDLTRYERFAASFYRYMGVQRCVGPVCGSSGSGESGELLVSGESVESLISGESGASRASSASRGSPRVSHLDTIDDFLFRLQARCGPLANAQQLAHLYVEKGVHVSGLATEELLSTLSRHFAAQRDTESAPLEFRDKIRADLGVVQDLLAADITPGSLRFLLVWIESTDELWPLLKIAESNAREIYSECQLDLVRLFERLGLASHKNMAQLTGLLARITAHAPLQGDTIGQMLLAYARAGNASGVESALEMHRQQVEGPLPPQVVETLLDSFPMRNYGSTSEQSRNIIAGLRAEIPTNLRHKWIYALFRAGGNVSDEWVQSKDKPQAAQDADYIMALIATVGASSPAQFELLNVALASPYRTHIIQQVRAGQLIDSVVLNRFIAKYVMENGEVSDDEVDAMLPDLENAHSVVRNQDAELIWPLQVV